MIKTELWAIYATNLSKKSINNILYSAISNFHFKLYGNQYLDNSYEYACMKICDYPCFFYLDSRKFFLNNLEYCVNDRLFWINYVCSTGSNWPIASSATAGDPDPP